MTFSPRVVFVVLFILILSGVSAQQNVINADVYGSDPLLYNGKFYTFYPPVNTGGNQYFSDRQFESGYITLRGVKYSDLQINYDIYNQQLILKYKYITGANNLIIISDAWLESFGFRNFDFEIISSQDTAKKIFQVLGKGPYRILYYWDKKLDLDSFYGSKNHVFSVARRYMNLLSGNMILKYSYNRSFSSLFDAEKKIIVKDYLRSNKIKVRKASDQSMTELINYCNTF